ncbi:MAG: ATP-dependent Clp protease proteolytic subunit [Myxococcales bacterium]|nr:ATP-dependent Clp protease proteolytic subunit [Myxococcales bacterium]
MSDVFAIEVKEEVELAPAPRVAHVINLGLDWETQTINLNDEIGPDSGEYVWGLLDYWSEYPVNIHLSTPGGDVDSMYQIHDAIRRHGNVTITAYGLVASAGVLILACGHRRLVTESTAWMSHESWGGGGDVGYRAAKDRRAFDEFQHKWWCELMSRYTPHDAKWWDKSTQRHAEYWLLGGQAIVEAGYADEVVR